MIRKGYVLLLSGAQVLPTRRRRAGGAEPLRTTMTCDASAAPSRGPRHANACAATYCINQHTLCSFLGIGSGHRQLIAVHCIAEHA